MSRPLRWAAALASVLAVGLTVGSGAGAAQAASYIPVNGSGSTWSQIAVDTWRADVRASGIVINFNGNGSSAGRVDYYGAASDFAVSEIPFQPPQVVNGRPTDDELAAAARRPYAYLPIVAGGTSFMYHLTVAGKRVSDLRLSGETLTKIFTGVITNWSDPQITREYGRALPTKRIVPVIRSDGSGTSAQFTRYMSKVQSGLWNSFCQRYANVRPPCPLQSFYPVFPGAVGQSGSNGVSNYVAASYGEGAITYVEAAYPERLGFPVVKVLNAAGYYSLPTAANVSVALVKAKINSDLTQNLDAVYANRDPRTYPLSSYSYMIVPVDTTAPFSAAKGTTLSTFINYFLCAGQRKADTLGYAPLPINLVQAAQTQLRRIPGAVAPTPVAQCSNPAFQILASAPQPNPCDKLGATCGATRQQPGGTRTTGTQQSTSTGTRNNGQTGSTGQQSAAPGAGPQPIASGGVDGETGLTSGGTTGGDQQQAVALPVVLSSSQQPGSTGALSVIAVAELLLAVLVPPVLAVALRRRRPGAPR